MHKAYAHRYMMALYEAHFALLAYTKFSYLLNTDDMHGKFAS